MLLLVYRPLTRYLVRLYAHGGDWKQALTVRRGYEFNYKLIAKQVEAHTWTLPPVHSFIRLKNDHVALTAMKKVEDGNALLLRFYEWAGSEGNVEITVPAGATRAEITNLIEKPEALGALSPATGSRIIVPVHPYEIVSVRVEYPEK